MSGPVCPEAERTAWQIAAEAGRVVAINALQDKLRRRMERGDSERALMALLIGGLSGIAQIMGSAAIPEKAALMEEIALAYVRGPMRGLDGPINADGSPFETPEPAELRAEPQ